MLCEFGSMLQQRAETTTAGKNAAAADGAHETSCDMAAIGGEERIGPGGGGSGVNRWPRQETVALLQIRSEMDAVFRDSSHKSSLWEEVSRKMAGMGYHRSAKKCREKFENVLKYHNRTKDGRSTKSDAKNYRFFQQLEALQASASCTSGAVPIAMAMPPPPPPPQPQGPPPSTATQPQAQLFNTVLSTTHPLLQPVMSSTPVVHHIPAPLPAGQNAIPMCFPSSTSGTPSSSSSTSSDQLEVMRSKRKWKDFCLKLTRDVMEKQEELHSKFLKAIDKRENDRMVQEEAWKAQEVARLKREHDVLVQERSMAAAKDAALISFLQKISDHKKIPLPAVITQSHSQPPPRPSTPTTPAPATDPVPMPQQINNGDLNSGGYSTPVSSSRWPKAEIDALIKLRTNMDHKYEDSGPKGALWEEISMEMRNIGYNRNAKRCKEKWENINKYFKKVKESNKRRRDDAKTCPYYDQLEALYSEKKHKLPIMAQPEQQWPLPTPLPEQDPVSDNMDQDDEDEDDDDYLEGGYEIVANSSNGASMGGATAAMATS